MQQTIIRSFPTAYFLQNNNKNASQNENLQFILKDENLSHIIRLEVNQMRILSRLP